MTIGGWITMGICWSVVITLCVVLIKKTLQNSGEEQIGTKQKDED